MFQRTHTCAHVCAEMWNVTTSWCAWRVESPQSTDTRVLYFQTFNETTSSKFDCYGVFHTVTYCILAPLARVFCLLNRNSIPVGFALQWRQAEHLSATVFLFSSTCAIDASTASKFGDLISYRFKIRRFDFRSIYGVPRKSMETQFRGDPPQRWSATFEYFFRQSFWKNNITAVIIHSNTVAERC